MSGGHLAKFKQAFMLRVVFAMIFGGILILGCSYVIFERYALDTSIAVSLMIGLTIIISTGLAVGLSKILIKPTEYIAQAIFHISPNEHFIAAPNVEALNFGKELASNLTRQIYDYAVTGKNTTNTPAVDPVKPQDNSNIIDQLPVGIIGLDPFGNIKLINKTAMDVFELHEPVGLPLETQLQIRFVSQSIHDWIKEVKNQSINAHKLWRKADISSNNEKQRSYYDIAAIYRQGHSSGIETILALFSHDDTFKIEEDALNLIALSVHEIRTPLTILKGYVDVLKQELSGKLDSQNQEYFDRLNVSSQNLSTLMTNVLSVVKADQNQLNLALKEESWPDNLTQMIDGVRERASVRGKELIVSIANGLPSVALDKLSTNEVIINLVENAIKYSPAEAKTIWIESKLDSDGMVLTTVRDEGVGIPESVLPNLFTKFHRNHRTKNSVVGTGLGLFLSKAIVSAHHGNIWIKSAEGQGTTVGFTLLPYSKLADEIKQEDNGAKNVTHGWIKNHSMQRR